MKNRKELLNFLRPTVLQNSDQDQDEIVLCAVAVLSALEKKNRKMADNCKFCWKQNQLLIVSAFFFMVAHTAQ